MDFYIQQDGFLGTGASLVADFTLIAYLLLIIPGMLAGWYFARNGKHRPHHKWTMVVITVVNWILIIGLMFVAYQFDVAGNIGEQPSNFRYLMPTIHAVFGFPAQILATIIIINMLREDSAVAAAIKRGETDLQKYWWNLAKPIMRLTIILWLITATFGVVSYLIRYDVLTLPSSAESIDPVVTEEPLVTEEAQPVETEEPVMTDEPDMVETEDAEPMETDEPEMVETEEPAMTEEAQSADPVETEEAEPTATDEPEPAETEEMDSEDEEPAMTEEADPATTEEASD